jgi:hypothetical protein
LPGQLDENRQRLVMDLVDDKNTSSDVRTLKIEGLGAEPEGD